MRSYEIIGDIHAQAAKLERLLARLGYAPVDAAGLTYVDTSADADRRLVFLGDLIDRGRENRRVIEIVRRLVERGDALAVMGNHEFNAICYHSRDPESGEPLRSHSEKHRRQHQSFLDEYPLDSPAAREVIDWFKTLPLYLELGDRPEDRALAGGEAAGTLATRRDSASLRCVHACWDQAQIDYLRRRLGAPARLDEPFLRESVQPGTPAYEAIETTLKGPELPLPQGGAFVDEDGQRRRRIRRNWWDGGTTYRDTAVVPAPERPRIPDTPIPHHCRWPPYPPEAPPVFFGHYWRSGEVDPLRPNVACLDYSAGRNGPVVAYRWREDCGGTGPRPLRKDRFLSSDAEGAN